MLTFKAANMAEGTDRLFCCSCIVDKKTIIKNQFVRVNIRKTFNDIFADIEATPAIELGLAEHRARVFISPKIKLDFSENFENDINVNVLERLESCFDLIEVKSILFECCTKDYRPNDYTDSILYL